MLVVGEDALDVERLRTAGEREVVDQRLLDGLSTLVITAVRPVSTEVEDTVVGKILERVVEIRSSERGVSVADTTDVWMLCHELFPSFASRLPTVNVLSCDGHGD